MTTSNDQSPAGDADAIPYGFNVIAHASGNLGLAVAARNTLRALSPGARTSAWSTSTPAAAASGHDLTYAHLECKASPPPFAINLLHMNPPDISA